MTLVRELSLSMADQLGGPAPSTATINDKSRRANNSVAMTAITWSQLPTGLWVPNFDVATTSGINVGTDRSLDIRYALTLAAWIKSPSLATDRGIITKDDTVGNSRAYYLRFAGHTLNFAIHKSDAASTSITASTGGNVWDRDIFVFVVATYLFVTDGTSRLRLYINGFLSNSSNAGVGPIQSCTTATWIGRRVIAGAENYYTGQISKWRIWERVFSQAEVATMFGAERRFYGV
ncbi:MAG: LamG domain-containing protein [Candidatus Marinimicrobia bacterium]|nr:LamG domain-containing protein [Candidatus Neomarinimicrobiota bacterium]MDD5539108.1 LamG domain-containing protein [Candidatus Neomarinimicrobiota bacterium]